MFNSWVEEDIPVVDLSEPEEEVETQLDMEPKAVDRPIIANSVSKPGGTTLQSHILPQTALSHRQEGMQPENQHPLLKSF